MEATDPNYLLEQVTDQDSFVRFIKSLADGRERAQEIENANPNTYLVDGALNWENASIQDFLYAALEYFIPGQFHIPDSEPNWRMFAEFLYFGKIYE